MRQLECGLDIDGVEYFLYGGSLRRVTLNYRAQSIRNHMQALRKRLCRTCSNDTGIDQTMCAPVAFDHAISRTFRAAIDSQDAHFEFLCG